MLRDELAALTARLVRYSLRTVGFGGGTALPGLVALFLDPNFVKERARLLKQSVVVSGTNGKTTTTRLLSSALKTSGLRVVSNQAGSNLQRGVAAALTDKTWSIAGAVGVFEADEFAFPDIAADLRPGTVVLLNLFRDQLDRYGELDTIRRRWRLALSSAKSLVIANGDDPLVTDVVMSSGSVALYFGFAGQVLPTSRQITVDVVRCPRCYGRLQRPFISYAHLGDYKCASCGFRRPPLSLQVSNILHGRDWCEPTQIEVEDQSGVVRRFTTMLRGAYSAYNIAAACLAAGSVGVGWDCLGTAVSSIKPAFGRGEKLELMGTSAMVVLVKNPTGFQQAVAAYASSEVSAYLIVINDLIADGTDVSWLWDVDLGPIVEQSVRVVCSGLRAADMALRLKYAGLTTDRLSVEPSLVGALHRVVELAGPGGKVVILPTYTALLELRRLLHRMGIAEPFWKG